MSKKVSEDAIAKLANLGSKILYKAQLEIGNKRVIEFAKLYAVVRRGSEKLEDEELKPRLTGELNQWVNEQLSCGHDALGKGTLEIAKSMWLIGDVYVMGHSCRKSIDKKCGSLAEYV